MVTRSSIKRSPAIRSKKKNGAKYRKLVFVGFLEQKILFINVINNNNVPTSRAHSEPDFSSGHWNSEIHVCVKISIVI